VVIKPTTIIDQVLRGALLTGFILYSGLPFLTEPMKKQNDKVRLRESIEAEKSSLIREITGLKSEHENLILRDRITLANRVAHSLATREEMLRNILATDRATIATESEERLPSWVLALQRLLFVAVNLFLTHHVAGLVSQQKKKPATVLQLVARSGATTDESTT